jgi:primosomal protein N' (replication factor Y)
VAPASTKNELLIVTVVPDVAGLDGKTFDYVVPDPLRDHVRVGTMVRIQLAGRRVGAWVVATDVAAPAGVMLKPIAKVTGWGPSATTIDLARWASWRWAGRLVHLLDTASPPGAVPALPRGRPAQVTRRDHEVVVVRAPPSSDVLPIVRREVAFGPTLIIAASLDTARRVGSQLRAGGEACCLAPRDWVVAAAGGVSVLGSRAAAWAPMPALAGIVVLDEHDERLQEERAPTWHAREVAIERARRAGVPITLVSPCPSLEALAAADRVVEPSRAEERAGWPILDVVDRRKEDPRSAGLYSERLVQLLRDRDRGRVVCVLNRKGRARMLVCGSCGEVARCERCDAAVMQPDDGVLRCPRCDVQRPVVCTSCGSGMFRNVRAGVTRAAEELAALAGEAVGDDERIVVGTEAVLHQVGGHVGVVAFLDFDQELLAPRYRAGEEALGLLALGARMLGPRGAGGRLLAQTRHPQHPVLDAVLHAEPDRASAADRAQRVDLRFPPFAALAAVSGAAAPDLIDALGSPPGVDVLGPADGRWLLRAADHVTLCDALAATTRPAGRVRIEVDPARV